MTNSRLIWDDARPFLAVARLGTLSAAASHLHIGIATLSRRIERLENALGVPLFIRGQSGYQLTEDGLTLIDKAEILESAALTFSSVAAARAEIVGRVCLATAETLATEIIVPALPRFMQLYPRLNVEIVTDIRTANLHRRDADLALRMVNPDRGNMSLQRVGTLSWGLYASESYLLQRPFNDSDKALSGHSIIAWSESRSELSAAKWIDSFLRTSGPTISASSLQTQLAAAKAGLGLAALPHYLGRGAGLKCLRKSLGLDQPIYLVVQSDLAQSARIRVMCDFLREVMAEKRSFFEPDPLLSITGKPLS